METKDGKVEAQITSMDAVAVSSSLTPDLPPAYATLDPPAKAEENPATVLDVQTPYPPATDANLAAGVVMAGAPAQEATVSKGAQTTTNYNNYLPTNYQLPTLPPNHPQHMLSFCIFMGLAAQAFSQDLKNCGKASELFAFNPPTLQYPAGVAAANFTVQLTSKPAGTVSQALNIDGFTMHPNILNYTPDNWNVPQTVTLVAKPNIYSTGSAANLKLRYGVNAPCSPTIHTCESTYDVKYESSPPKTCVSSGDPHLKLFDGSKCEGQDHGGFYLFKNQHMEVQAHHYQCGNYKCNGAASIRYGDSVVIVSAMKKYGSNSVGKTVEYNRISEQTTGISVNSDTKDQWVFTTDDGTVVTISTHMFTEMSITINASPYMASIKQNSGVCAKSCKWNTHRVPDSENHMVGRYTKGSLFPPLAAWWGKDYKDLVPGIKFTEADYKKSVCAATTTSSLPAASSSSTTSSVAPATSASSTTSAVVVPSTSSATTSGVPAPSSSTAASTTSSAAATTASSTTTTGAAATSSSSSTGAASSSSSSSASSSYMASSSTVPPAGNSPSTSSSASSSVASMTTTSIAASPSPSVYIPIYDPNNYNYTVPSTNTTTPGTPIYSDADKVKATLQCREILNVPGCDGLIAEHIEFLIDACVADYLLTGTHIFSTGHLAALNAQCHHQCETIIAAPIQVSNNTNVAANVQIIAGYNNNTCINSCSAKGQCSAKGCICDAPWSGIDCSINLSQYSPPQPPMIKCDNGTTYQGTYVAPAALNPAAAAVIAQYQPAAPGSNSGGIYTVGPLKTTARGPAATGVLASGARGAAAVVGIVSFSVLLML
ncbi:hypothetical protein HDU77_010711 [Chytriomyces hyalinus]|nr:hypothetical protein HDU77_010711 [Chytriomyces hyalinus]